MVMRISRPVIATPAPVKDDSSRGYAVDPVVRKSGCRLSGEIGVTLFKRTLDVDLACPGDSRNRLTN